MAKIGTKALSRFNSMFLKVLALLLIVILHSASCEVSNAREQSSDTKIVAGLFQSIEQDFTFSQPDGKSTSRKRLEHEKGAKAIERKEITRLRHLLAESRLKQILQIQKLAELKKGVEQLVKSLNTSNASPEDIEGKREDPQLNNRQSTTVRWLEDQISNIQDFARVNYETGEIEVDVSTKDQIPAAAAASDLRYHSAEKKSKPGIETITGGDLPMLLESSLADPAMLHADLKLLVDIAILQCAAALGGIVAAMLRMPPIVGYMMGGAAVGPSGSNYIRSVVHVETIAQFGSILFLFAHGVQYSKKEQRTFYSVTSLGTILSIGAYTVVIQLVALLSEIASSPLEGGLVGISSSMSSLSVVLDFVHGEKYCTRVEENVGVGIISFQGLLMGLLFSVPPALSAGSISITSISLALGRASILLLCVIVASMGCVRNLAHPALRYLSTRAKYEDVFLLGVVSLAMSMALVTEYLGLSMDLGAFFAGMFLADTPLTERAIALTRPLASFFASLLFASIGMIINVRFFASNFGIILFLVVTVSITKFLVHLQVVRLFGFSWRTALLTGGSLAHIGEFSLLLSSKLHAHALLSRRVYLLFLAATVSSLVLSPLVLRMTIAGVKQWVKVTGEHSKV